MPRPPLIERARLYVAKMPPAVSGGGGHNATFAVACALLRGFSLSEQDARVLLDEFNLRCDPPWAPHELDHKMRSAAGGEWEAGYLLNGTEGYESGQAAASGAPRVEESVKDKPKFDPSRLEPFAGHWANVVDLVWLANRSYIEPSLVNSGSFLRHIFREGESALIFTNQRSQGETLWPDDDLPTGARDGVWFLCQPVDGIYHPNPRTQTMSRRSEESVTSWRYLVLESDEAPARLWLGALAQLPLRIAAIYSSGGRSVHALVRVDAATKSQWDDEKHRMKNGLIILGADPGAMSAVRLTRLPGCVRESKQRTQKLLYLNHEPTLMPLCEMLARRDVEADWLKLAACGIADSDITGGSWLRRGLGYYANVSPRLRAALAALESEAAA